MEQPIQMRTKRLQTRIMDFGALLICMNIVFLLFQIIFRTVTDRNTNMNCIIIINTVSSLLTIILNLNVCISIGVGIVAAQKAKTGNHASVVRIAYIYGLVCSGIITVLCLVLAPTITSLYSVPTEIIAQCTVYFRIIILGIPFAMLYLIGTALYKAQENIKKPLLIMILSGAVGIVLLILLRVLSVGVYSSAIALLVTQIIAGCFMLIQYLKRKDDWRLQLRATSESGNITLLMVLHGISICFFLVIYMLYQNRLYQYLSGESMNLIVANASARVFFNFVLYILLAVFETSLYISARCYGVGDLSGVKLTGRFTSLSGLVIGCGTGIVMTLFSDVLLRLVTEQVTAAPEVKLYFIAVGIGSGLLGVMFGLAGCMSGISLSPLAVILTLIGFAGVGYIWLVAVVEHVHTISAYYATYPIGWFAAAFLLLIMLIVIIKDKEKHRNREN